MRQDVYAVILAGGRGERFWPLSTSRRPKQLLSIVGDKPLLACAIERVKGIVPAGNVFVITNADLLNATRAALPCFPCENVIGEPVGRDTAPAVTLGAALVKARNPGAAFCVLTADHVIGDTETFARTLNDAFEMTSSDTLITIGIKPSFAGTGFGYIQAGKVISAADKGLAGPTRFLEVKSFVEKPDFDTAARYFQDGSFYWNSGMFIWSVNALESALARHCPELKDLLNKLEPVVGAEGRDKMLASVYARLERISIDYALMEKADNIIMAEGDFAWDDVGTWTALEKHLPMDARGNVAAGKVEILDSADNVVVSEQGLVALCGVNNMVVVRTDTATLICPKDRAQDVKMLVELLRNKGLYNKQL